MNTNIDLQWNINRESLTEYLDSPQGLSEPNTKMLKSCKFSQTAYHENRFLCQICLVDTFLIQEMYMVNKTLWLKANPKPKKLRPSIADLQSGMLCISCLESQIKRKLHKFDFTPAPINFPDEQMKSPQLFNRLTSQPHKDNFKILQNDLNPIK